MALNRSDFGVTASDVARPGSTLTLADVVMAVPLAVAVIDADPATVPAVTCVVAMPDASVVADDGDSVSAPELENVTSTPDTAMPFASLTLMANEPALPPT